MIYLFTRITKVIIYYVYIYTYLLVFVKLWRGIILHCIESSRPAKPVALTWQLHEAADGAANKIHRLLAKAKPGCIPMDSPSKKHLVLAR